MTRTLLTVVLFALLVPASLAAADECESFSIGLLGDTRNGFYSAFPDNLRSIDQLRPRPIGLFNSGDITPDGERQQWLEHHQALVDAVFDASVEPDPSGIPRQSAFATESTGWVWDPGGRIRYVPIMGNHDYYDGDRSIDNLNEFFPWLADVGAAGEIGANQRNGLYYYLTYENALFLILDSEHPSDQQTAWLESVLQKPEFENMWKLAFFHHPPMPCGGGKSPFDEGLPWMRLFETYQVNLVLLGHTHTTERTCRMIDGICVPDAEFGVMYLNSSGGGVPTRDIDISITDSLVFQGDSINYNCGQILEFGEARHHFYQLTFDGDTLTGKGYYAGQSPDQVEPFDRFTLTNARAGSCGADEGADPDPTPDPTPQPEPENDPSIAGGCRTTDGSASTWFGAMAIGLLAFRRRRRRRA